MKVTKNESYLIEKLIGPICCAIAYAFCTGETKKNALLIFPGSTRSDKLDEILLQKGFERVVDEKQVKNKTLRNFSTTHKRGRFLITCEGSPTGHAVALIDGQLYNADGWENKKISAVYQLEKNVLNAKESAYFTSIVDKDLKYAKYCQDYIYQTYGINPPDIVEISRDSFKVKLNNKSFEIEFPFFCTDQDVKDIIEEEVSKNIHVEKLKK